MIVADQCRLAVACEEFETRRNSAGPSNALMMFRFSHFENVRRAPRPSIATGKHQPPHVVDLALRNVCFASCTTSYGSVLSGPARSQGSPRVYPKIKRLALALLCALALLDSAPWPSTAPTGLVPSVALRSLQYLYPKTSNTFSDQAPDAKWMEPFRTCW